MDWSEKIQKILKFVKKILETYPEAFSAIILFGSRARGDWKRNSDWDIAFILREGEENRLEMRRKISSQALWKSEIGFFISPIIIETKEDWHNPENWITNPSLAASIYRDGIRLDAIS